MNIRFYIFIFFIKISNIISNVLYINEDILLEDNIINYNWLKSAIRRNEILVISEIETINDTKDVTFFEHKEIQDPKYPEDKTKKIKIKKEFITKKICNSEKELVKIEINDLAKIDEIIEKVKNELKTKKYKNIEKIVTKITEYKSKENKEEISYEYDVYSSDKKIHILRQKYSDENNNNNPSIITIFKNEIGKKIFFSYFQVEDDFGIFENSEVEIVLFNISLKKNNSKFNNLFKNSKNLENIGIFKTLNNITEYENIIEGCCNLIGFNYYTCNNYSKISFKNLNKLNGIYIFPINKSNNLILNNETFYNCEDFYFNNIKINLFINKDTTGLNDVFYNLGKNSKEKHDVKITIEKDTVLDEINLDTMFNNSYFTRITIINKSNKKITGSLKLFENKNLNSICIVNSSSAYYYDRDMLECKTFEGEFYKDIEGLKFEDYLEDHRIYTHNFRAQIFKDEEKKRIENEKNNNVKAKIVIENNNKDENNSCLSSFFKIFSCCCCCKKK